VNCPLDEMPLVTERWFVLFDSNGIPVEHAEGHCTGPDRHTFSAPLFWLAGEYTG
jgi:hypothetical protein